MSHGASVNAAGQTLMRVDEPHVARRPPGRERTGLSPIAP
jgi:hypothetical protein